jgi:Response regulator containing a CheY-like receiver domain and an HTH DNA-binding domain
MRQISLCRQTRRCLGSTCCSSTSVMCGLSEMSVRAMGRLLTRHDCWPSGPCATGTKSSLVAPASSFGSRSPGGPTTERLQPPPTLTAREHEVLVWLCRPLLLGNAFTAPASVREIAAGLVVTPAAVKQHLARLYAKFDIDDVDSEMRRARLANAALSRGAITLADLQPISR